MGLSLNARPALDCDTDLRQCGDLHYRGRRQDRAVIAKQPLKHARGFETVTAWPFMARSNAAVSSASPAPTRQRASPSGWIGARGECWRRRSRYTPFPGPQCDRSAGLSLGKPPARVIANPAEDGGKGMTRAYRAHAPAKSPVFHLRQHAPDVDAKRAGRAAAAALRSAGFPLLDALTVRFWCSW